MPIADLDEAAREVIAAQSSWRASRAALRAKLKPFEAFAGGPEWDRLVSATDALDQAICALHDALEVCA